MSACSIDRRGTRPGDAEIARDPRGRLVTATGQLHDLHPALWGGRVWGPQHELMR